MFSELWVAAALMLVLEGIVPFASPTKFREALYAVQELSDQQLRWIGLASMLLGLGILILVN